MASRLVSRLLRSINSQAWGRSLTASPRRLLHFDPNAGDDDPPGYSASALEDKTLEEDYLNDPNTDEDGHIFDAETMDQLNITNKKWDPRDVLNKKRGGRRLEQELEELEKLPIMHVRCTFNNTYINICDNTGRILTWKSAGSEGYKNTRKGTTVAAQAVGLAAAHKARELGMHRVRVKLKGPGIGRQFSLKGFELGGLQIASIQDVTPVPHNGCKPKKKRRI